MSLRPDKKSGRSRSKSRTREPPSTTAPQPPFPAYATSTHQPITMGNYTDLPPEQRPGYTRSVVPPSAPQAVSYALPTNVPYAPPREPYPYSASSGPPHASTRTPSSGPSIQYASVPHNITYSAKPVVNTAQSSVLHNDQPASPAQPSPVAMPQAPPPPEASPAHVVYSPPPPPETPSAHIIYSPPLDAPPAHVVYSPPPAAPLSPSLDAPRPLATSTNQRDGHKVVEMVPGGGGGILAPPSPGRRPHSLSVSGHRPEGLRLDRLSVSGGRPEVRTFTPGGAFSGALPPPSPLLEAYHGTYQSISPMPSAVVFDDDLDHLPSLDTMSPLTSTHAHHHHHHHRPSFPNSSHSPPSRSKGKDRLALAAYDHHEDWEPPKKEKKRVKVYDATDDALALVEAMSAKPVQADALIDILPVLSHDQMLELRSEFKRHCKLQGRGVNIAKYIKLKTSGNFGKIAHVTALGKYESECFWANYWYQSHSSQRELLIEALMGRANYEIREIKEAFRDKRYSDSLVKCMDKELKADKFRKAILMALEGERQEESDVWDTEYRNRDVDTLYRALSAREGGESAMLSVVIMRSDTHLRDVLRTYERRFQANFARDALRKSNNLVGEVIAHILNGVINRPARDAMLLHHALMDLIDEPHRSAKRPAHKESSSHKHERQQRYELLTSRLVRLHWERMHFIRVKSEYEAKYGRLVEEDIEEATKGDFREFCLALCQK